MAEECYYYPSYLFDRGAYEKLKLAIRNYKIRNFSSKKKEKYADLLNQIRLKNIAKMELTERYNKEIDEKNKELKLLELELEDMLE